MGWRSKLQIHFGRQSDSTYASDESAKSVTGYSTTLNGAVISFKSKSQIAMTLSVTESELVAAIDCVCKILCLKGEFWNLLVCRLSFQ